MSSVKPELMCTVKQVCGDLLCSLCFPDVQETADLPEGASTPALGLSNKAVFQGDLTSQSPQQDGFDSVSDQYKESYFQPLKLTGMRLSVGSVLKSENLLSYS